MKSAFERDGKRDQSEASMSYVSHGVRNYLDDTNQDTNWRLFEELMEGLEEKRKGGRHAPRLFITNATSRWDLQSCTPASIFLSVERAWGEGW